jgi:hypothetical protein
MCDVCYALDEVRWLLRASEKIGTCQLPPGYGSFRVLPDVTPALILSYRHHRNWSLWLADGKAFRKRFGRVVTSLRPTVNLQATLGGAVDLLRFASVLSKTCRVNLIARQ